MILFNLSGHGNFDVDDDDASFVGKLENVDMPREEVVRAMAELKTLPVSA